MKTMKISTAAAILPLFMAAGQVQAASTIVSSSLDGTGTATFTAATTDDWAHWGTVSGNLTNDSLLAASDYSNEPGTRMISDMTKIETTTFTASDFTGAGDYSWDNGTNITVVTDRPGGLQVAGIDNGYSFTVTPGAISTLTVDVYAGARRSTGTMTATLFDATDTMIGSAAVLNMSSDSAGNNFLFKGTFGFELENATDYIRFDLVKTGDIGTGGGRTIWASAAAVSFVPEPSSAVLLGLGGLALILRRRK